jgi:integrase/recombinase XerC
MTTARQHFYAWLRVKEASCCGASIMRMVSATNALWKEFGEAVPLRRLTQPELARFVRLRLEKYADNPNTVRLRLRYLSEFFRWLVQNGVIEKSPLDNFPKIREADVYKTPFLWEEFQQLLDVAPFIAARNSINWRHAILVGWHTGLRLSDCALLKWSEVDMISDEINVRPHKMWHVRRQVGIPIEPSLRTHLMGLLPEGLLLPATDDYVDPWFAEMYRRRPDTLCHQFRVMCDRLALHRHSFHSLRHGFVTRLINAGVEATVISSMTGQSLETIQDYAHVSVAARREALERSRRHQESPRREYAA